MPSAPFSVPPGRPSSENGANGIEKLLLKTKVSILHSEVNPVIYVYEDCILLSVKI
jgi:hypothetical protein